MYQTETGQQNNCYVGKLNGQHHLHSELQSGRTEEFKKIRYETKKKVRLLLRATRIAIKHLLMFMSFQHIRSLVF